MSLTFAQRGGFCGEGGLWHREAGVEAPQFACKALVAKGLLGHCRSALRGRVAPVLAQHPQQSAPSSATPQPTAAQTRPPPPVLDRAGGLSDRLLRDYLSGWAPQYNEYDYYVPPEAVYGTIPAELEGTLFLVGPSLTQAYGTSVRHPSDADGMVSSLAFGPGGRVFFRNRYVRTDSFVREQAAGRRLTRGMHDRGAPTPAGQLPPPVTEAPGAGPEGAAGGRGGAGRLASGSSGRSRGEGGGDGEWPEDEERRDGPRPFRLDPLALLGLSAPPPLSALFNPLDLAFRAPANANVVCWAGRLLVFSQGGSLPYELNKLSLETVGPYDVAGAMADLGRVVAGYKVAPPPPPQAAASKHAGAAGPSDPGPRLVLMGCVPSGPDALLRWAEVDGAGRLVGPPTTYRLPGGGAGPGGPAVADFWVTDSYYVVAQAPLSWNPERFLRAAALGAAAPAECLDWREAEPMRLHLVPRPRGGTQQAGQQAGQQGRQGAGGAGGGRRPKVDPRAPIVWPPEGPEAVVIDAPPLLPTSCVGSLAHTTAAGRALLLLDCVAQRGAPGAGGGALDCVDPDSHRLQPKPELVRITVDPAARTATARVLSQRTVAAATTPAAARPPPPPPAHAASSPAAAAAGGSGPWHAGGAPYGHLFAAASEADAAEGWAPPQAVLRLAPPPPPQDGAPAANANVGNGGGLHIVPAPQLRARLGTGCEAWSPGDRVFVGPPTFVPRRPQAPAPAPATSSQATSSPAAAPTAARTLPPLQSEVEAAAAAAAASTSSTQGALPGHSTASPHPSPAAPQGSAPAPTPSTSPSDTLLPPTDGWLLVPLYDAETGRGEVAVLDAAHVSRGPVAGVALPHHLPHVRGAAWADSYCGPGRAAPAGWRPRLGK